MEFLIIEDFWKNISPRAGNWLLSHISKTKSTNQSEVFAYRVIHFRKNIS